MRSQRSVLRRFPRMCLQSASTSRAAISSTMQEVSLTWANWRERLPRPQMWRSTPGSYVVTPHSAPSLISAMSCQTPPALPTKSCRRPSPHFRRSGRHAAKLRPLRLSDCFRGPRFACNRQTGSGANGFRLLVVDPVSLCVAGDSNKNAEVRRGLAPLKIFAERHGAAVVGVSHFSKGSEGRDPLSRVTGSLAFGAAPRLVLSAVTENRKPDEPEDAEPRHLFVRTKSNLGPSGD